MNRFARPVELTVVCSLVATMLPAAARWKPEYAQLPQSVRDWYQAQELTPVAQQIFHFENESWRRIPDYVVHWGRSAPDGRPTMFALEGMPVCFFPGDAGG